jgi:hypothetical protein
MLSLLHPRPIWATRKWGHLFRSIPPQETTKSASRLQNTNAAAVQSPTMAQIQHALAEYLDIDVRNTTEQEKVDRIYKGLTPKNKRVLHLIIERWPLDNLTLFLDHRLDFATQTNMTTLIEEQNVSWNDCSSLRVSRHHSTSI